MCNLHRVRADKFISTAAFAFDLLRKFLRAKSGSTVASFRKCAKHHFPDDLSLHRRRNVSARLWGFEIALLNPTHEVWFIRFVSLHEAVREKRERRAIKDKKIIQR